jgi:hypothetical protein
MRSKLICLLAFLFCCCLAAIPNRNADNRMACEQGQKIKKPATAKQRMVPMEDVELLPIHHILSNF